MSAPGGLLATLAEAATRDGGLGELDDDELIGALRAWHRLESWCASGVLTAVAELARRRPTDGAAPAPPGDFPDQLSEFIVDEIAVALTLTSRAAGTCQDLALDLAIRLPGTARALRGGAIDRAKALLIAEATRILTDEQARQVEMQILPAAEEQTTGQLRAAVTRAVLAVDPEAAARRRRKHRRIRGCAAGKKTPALPPWPDTGCPPPTCSPSTSASPPAPMLCATLA